MWKQRLTSGSLLAGIGVWAASLALYLATSAPTLTWGTDNLGVDGGEFLAAANTLGVPHPPGYPTYMVLLKLFAALVPVGDVAHRGNLLSAVLASLSVVLVYWVILRCCRHVRPEGPKGFHIVSAALGATIFAASPLFWSQAVITEVYALNALFAALLPLIASYLALGSEPAGAAPGPSAVALTALFAFLLGIGLGNHLTLLAIAAPLVAWLWAALGWKKVVTPWSLGTLILGLCIYIYLPLRAGQHPPVNWGSADSLSGFGWMITARAYQDYLFGVPAGSILSRVVDWLALVFTQLNPLGIFLALLGAMSLALYARRLLWASLASAAVLSIYSITYHTIDAEVLLIPVIMVFCIWAGVGFLGVLTSVTAWARAAWGPAKTRHGPGAAFYPLMALHVIAFGALPITSVILNYNSQDLSEDRGAYQYASGVMDSVPEGSILLIDDERTVFSIWYLSYVEQPERDVAPIAVRLLQFDWYWDEVHARYPDRLPADGSTFPPEGIKQIVAFNAERHPVFFTYKTQALESAFQMEGMGNLFKASLKPGQ